MSRPFFIAFCWMMFLMVLILIAFAALAFVYAGAFLALLYFTWGIHPLIAIGIVAFVGMTVWSSYILYTR